MRARTLIFSCLLAAAVGGATSAFASGGTGPAVPYTAVYRLLPVNGCTYSVAFATSGTMAVGVSSNQQIVINADKEITLQPSQTLVPTTWTYASRDNLSMSIAGSTWSGLGSTDAALYGVSGDGGVAGTYFTRDGTTVYTTGFLGGATVTSFTASGVNSYGFGVAGMNGCLGVGWAMDNGVKRPCCYETSIPYGLLYTSASGVAGAVYRVANVPAGSLGRMVGKAGGNAVYWTVSGTTFTQHALPAGSSTAGAAYGMAFPCPPEDPQTTFVGVDTAGIENYAFWSTDPFTSISETIPGIAYGVSYSTYCGTTNGGAAFLSSKWTQYGTLYQYVNAVQGLGRGAFTSFSAGYDMTASTAIAGNWVVVGYGAATGSSQTAYVVTGV